MSALLVLVTADWTYERTYSAEALEEARDDWRVLEAYDGDLSLPVYVYSCPVFISRGCFSPKHLLFTLIIGSNMHRLKGRY